MSEREFRHRQDDRPPAAWTRHDDPNAANTARVIPADAKVVAVGGALIGYATPKRKHHRRLKPWQLNARQRRKELSAVALYRRDQELAMGPDLGWAFVIGNLLRVLHDHVTPESLQLEAAAIGRGEIDGPAVETAVQEIMGKAWGRYRLYTPAQAGTAIELTSVERTEAGVTKIDAMDEPRSVRRRRKNAEHMRDRRAARAAPERITKKQIAAALGVDVRTVFRMLKTGELRLDVALCVDSSSVSPLSSKDPTTETATCGPVHAKRDIRGGA